MNNVFFLSRRNNQTGRRVIRSSNESEVNNYTREILAIDNFRITLNRKKPMN